MSINAIYLCCIAEPWIAVANQLQAEMGIEPRYFIHWRQDQSAMDQLAAKRCYLQTVEEAWLGLGFPDDVIPVNLDQETRRRYASDELIAIKMMDRLDPLVDRFPFTQRQEFYLSLLGKWISIIQANDIKLILSPSVPHRVFDYALWVAAKICGVRFVAFQMSGFQKYSFLIEDIEELANNFPDPSLPVRPLDDHIRLAIERVRRDYASAVPIYMQNHAKAQKSFFARAAQSLVRAPRKFLTRPNTYWVTGDVPPYGQRPGWIKFYYLWTQRIFKLRRLRRTYQRYVTPVSSLPERYVLIALHYQPEETTCPSGGIYYDQIEIVKLLEATLPPDISIVVKEHKAQFNYSLEGASGRDSNFYEKLKSLSSRLYFVDTDADPFALIDKAQMVATVTGTTGWEAVLRGTRAIIFGRAWYSNMPGVTRVRTSEDVLRAYHSTLPDEAEIVSYHQRLQNHLVHAEHYKAVATGEIPLETSITHIAEAIKRHLGNA